MEEGGERAIAGSSSIATSTFFFNHTQRPCRGNHIFLANLAMIAMSDIAGQVCKGWKDFQ